jgi:type I restriction enzyme S subunit
MAETVTQTVGAWQRAGMLLVEDGNHGEYRPRPTEFAANGVAFIRASDIEFGTVRFDTASKINSTAVARITKGIGQPGDVLFSHKGTVGKLALVPVDAPPFVCSPQTTFWRVRDRKRIDPRYLYYYMKSWEFRQQWEACKGETDMADYVSLTAQRRMNVTIPALDEQERIVEVLGPLDDNINLNREMNETLDAVARSLFKSWFVDFDPVVAKREGRQPFGMDDETAALFPAHFQEDELGPIPQGWHVAPFSAGVDILSGGTPKTNVPDYWNGDIPWFSVVDTPAEGDLFVMNTEKSITRRGLEESAAQLLPVGTTIISARGTVGNLAITGCPMTMNQSCYALRGKNGFARAFTYLATSTVVDELRQISGGSVFDTIIRSTFDAVRVVVPPAVVALRFEEIASIWFDRILGNVKENLTLAALRDLLLPKLFSGEVRIRDVERVVSEIT